MTAPLLLLTDFSAAADHALIYARAVATQLQAPLVLLHVRRTSLLDRELLTGRLPQHTEGEIAVELSRRTAELSVPSTVEVASKDVYEAVADAVQRHQPQLIVLGRPDYNKPDELVDTTSLDLLRRTPVPLLVVPSTAPPVPNLQRAIIAADNQPFNLTPAAAEVGQRLLTAFNATVNITHVVEPEDDNTCTVAREQVEKSGLLTGLERVTARGQRHLHPVAGILAAAEESGAGLVVMIARHHSILQRLFYQSVSAQVVRRTLTPAILILPAQP
ncbi:universal stress protein [Hymenobacter sp. HD11105]|jgi:nucleotide-binding universal stress UspA family protein